MGGVRGSPERAEPAATSPSDSPPNSARTSVRSTSEQLATRLLQGHTIEVNARFRFLPRAEDETESGSFRARSGTRGENRERREQASGNPALRGSRRASGTHRRLCLLRPSRSRARVPKCRTRRWVGGRRADSWCRNSSGRAGNPCSTDRGKGMLVFGAPALLLLLAIWATTRSSLARAAAVTATLAVGFFLFYGLGSGTSQLAWTSSTGAGPARCSRSPR